MADIAKLAYDNPKDKQHNTKMKYIVLAES